MIFVGAVFLALAVVCALLCDGSRSAISHDMYYVCVLVFGFVGLCCLAIVLGKALTS